MTDVGNQLLTKAQDVGVAIDSLVISNNKPNGDLSKLDESFFDTKIPINAKNVQDTTLQVESVLNNDDFNADYPVNVVGITAHMQGSNDSVLLAVAEADEPEVIPASTDIKYTQYFDFSITNDKQANITAEINPSGIVSNDAFSNAVNSLTSANDNNVSSLNSDINSLSATDSNNTNSLSSAVNSLSTADSSNTNSLSSAVSSLSSSNNLNFDMLSGLIGNYALASLVDSQFENYATNSSVASQIASTESYANSVATSTVRASAVIDNHNNTVTINGQTHNIMAVYSVNTDANTLTTPGYVLLQANLNHTNVPLNTNWDYIINTISEGNNNLIQIAWSSGYASYWQRTYWDNNGNWEWAPWYTMATTVDTNNAYQNAVNTASGYTNQQIQSAISSANSYAVQDNHDGTITVNGNRYVMQQSLPSSTDLNTLTIPGNYSIAYGNTTNKPSNFLGAIYLLVMGNGTDVFQLGASAGSSPMWRMKQWGSWTNWNNL